MKILNSDGLAQYNVTAIAFTCHEVNKAYCESIGDHSQVTWNDAPDWQRKSAINGVIFVLKNPDAPVSASHESWLKEKTADGWIYGEVKDAEKKTHPCCVPYDELPVQQKTKDYLFKGVVVAAERIIADIMSIKGM